MSDEKKTTEKTEVTTETKKSWGSPEYKKETTVKTERTVEKEKDDAEVIIIEE